MMLYWRLRWKIIRMFCAVLYISVVHNDMHQGCRSLWDMVTSPPNILEVMSFRMSTGVTATVVCCILTQILYVVSQKSFSFWRTSSPIPPPGLCPWTPLGSPDLQSSFMSPNNHVRSTPLICTHEQFLLLYLSV